MNYKEPYTWSDLTMDVLMGTTIVWAVVMAAITILPYFFSSNLALPPLPHYLLGYAHPHATLREKPFFSRWRAQEGAAQGNICPLPPCSARRESK